VIRRLDGRRGIPGKAEQAETFGPGVIDTAGRDPLWPMVRRTAVFLARNGPVSDASSIMPRARRCLSFGARRRFSGPCPGLCRAWPVRHVEVMWSHMKSITSHHLALKIQNEVKRFHIEMCLPSVMRSGRT
jgi:hypothetical protein